MNATNPPDRDHAAGLAESEKDAAAPQPGTYRDEANGEKVVEVLPVDGDSVPIQGVDPKR